VTDIPSTVTRIVVVHPGGDTERWADNWTIHIQDDGRTVKFFPNGSGAVAKAERDAALGRDLREIFKDLR
jgi:hypothetical protein